MSLNIPDTNKHRVIVAGGGFAGLKIISTLSATDFDIVLIDRNNYHKFQPLLYQVATSALNAVDIAFPFRKLFKNKENLHYRMAEITAIEAGNKMVITDKGAAAYDTLILCTGSNTNFFGMRNIERNAMTMKELTDSLAIRDRVLYNLEKAMVSDDASEKEALTNIVIVGGGASGVELAGAFAEMKKNVIPKDFPEMSLRNWNIYLIEGTEKLIGTMSGKTSQGSLRDLKKMGVNVVLNGKVVDYADNKVILENGPAIPTYNFIWTSGVKISLPEGLENATRNKSGRILTDSFFKVAGYDNIYAVGDAAMQQTREFPNGYPQLAREAIEQGGQLAKNMNRKVKGINQRPHKRRKYPVMATIGRNKAYAEYGRFSVGGFFGWIMWAGVHLISILGIRNKFSVLFEWSWNYISADHPDRIIVDKTDYTTNRTIESN